MPWFRKKTAAITRDKSLYAVAAAGLATALLGVIAPLIFDNTILVKLTYIVIILTILLLGIIVGATCLGIFFQAQDMMKHVEDLRDRVSPLVTFAKRSEIITVTDDGDGIFDCTHVVEYNPHDDDRDDWVIEQLHFPVLIDLPSGNAKAGANVEQLSITVDGNPIAQGAYVPQESRVPYSNGSNASLLREYGIVQVPVRLSINNRTVRIHTKIKYKSIFKDRYTSDYVIVDIPHVTRKLSVTIRAANNSKRIVPAPGDALTATCQMMDLKDRVEEIKQSAFIEADHAKEIVWSTENAKIGYRYALRFKVADQA
jgi:hypothetical protein